MSGRLRVARIHVTPTGHRRGDKPHTLFLELPEIEWLEYKQCWNLVSAALLLSMIAAPIIRLTRLIFHAAAALALVDRPPHGMIVAGAPMETAIVPGLTATGSKTTMIRSITADHLADEALADLWLGLERYDLVDGVRAPRDPPALPPIVAARTVLADRQHGGLRGKRALGLISTTLFKQDVHLTLPYILPLA